MWKNELWRSIEGPKPLNYGSMGCGVFKWGDIKLERINNTKRNFEFWSNGNLSKSFKKCQNLTFKVNFLCQKPSKSFSFLTAISHRGLRNDFFFQVASTFPYSIWTWFPFSIWNFNSLFYLDISRHLDTSIRFETFRDISRHFEIFQSFFNLSNRGLTLDFFKKFYIRN